MRTIVRGPVILVACAGVIVFAGGVGRGDPAASQQAAGKAAADECLTKPGSSSPQGTHWYYRVDHASGRHCWYLGPLGTRVHAREAPARVSSPKPAAEPAAPRLAPAVSAEPSPPPAASQIANAEPANAVPVAPPAGASAPEPEATPSVGPQPWPIIDAAEDSQDEMPPVWPVLGANEGAAAAPPAQANVRWEYVLATIAGALALAAMLVSATFKRSLPHTTVRARPPAQHRPPPSTRSERASAPPPSMYLPPRHRLAAKRRTVEPPRRDEAPPLQPAAASDAADVEVSLQRLLRAWQRAAA